jgi:3-hydroxyisobutyrate dehydrogenase-like beta-hydroxyacid dehydrogenase
MRIGFIGLGNMGAAIAANLADARHDVAAGFAAPLGLKDMRLVGQSAESLRVPMPLLSLLRDHLLQTIAQQGEDVDWSAIAHAIKKNAALDHAVTRQRARRESGSP